MSQENLEKLRRTYEAFSRGDFDAVIEIAHPEIEFVRVGGQAPVLGADAFRAWMEPDIPRVEICRALLSTWSRRCSGSSLCCRGG